MEAWRLLGEVPGVRAACCEVQAGGVTIAQLVEAMEDVWWVVRLCNGGRMVGGEWCGGSVQKYCKASGVSVPWRTCGAWSGHAPDGVWWVECMQRGGCRGYCRSWCCVSGLHRRGSSGRHLGAHLVAEVDALVPGGGGRQGRLESYGPKAWLPVPWRQTDGGSHLSPDVATSCPCCCLTGAAAAMTWRCVPPPWLASATPPAQGSLRSWRRRWRVGAGGAGPRGWCRGAPNVLLPMAMPSRSWRSLLFLPVRRVR